MKNLKNILNKISERINPEEDLKEIKKVVDDFSLKFNEIIKKEKINAEIFIGGSFSKNTMLKRNKYDVDIFIRFDKKYEDNELSKLTENMLSKMNINFSVIKGSRNYFRIDINKKLYLEIIPVLKIKNQNESKNVTDLSYSHVNYIKKKLTKTQYNEVRLAKEFCYAKKCYGAESYVQGFSGYSLELLIIHYKTFLNFIEAMSQAKKTEQIIIDIEKHHKNKHQIKIDINASKLQSPIILIDPTYKYRNATAALSKKTFYNFSKECKKFLNNPNEKDFNEEKIDFVIIKNKSIKKNYEFSLIEIKTEKQEGDIAGTKLLKFFNHLTKEIEKIFIIKNKGFEYDEKKSAKIYFSVKKKNELIIKGPKLSQKQNIDLFKKSHKNTFVKSDRIYSIEENKFTLKEFIKKWKGKNSMKINEMGVSEFNEINI